MNAVIDINQSSLCEKVVNHFVVRTFEYNGQYRVNVVGFGGRNTSIEISKNLYDQLNEYLKKNTENFNTYY